MSKSNPKVETPVVATSTSFSVSRKDSGYYITKHTITNGYVSDSTQVSEPDVLIICMAHLERLFRKELGL